MVHSNLPGTAVVVGGTGSTAKACFTYYVVGLVPYSYPVGRFLPTFVHHRGLSYTPPVAPPASFPCGLGFLQLLLLLLSFFPPFPSAPLTADARCCLFSCASSSCLFTMNRSAAWMTPRYHFPVIFLVGHSTVSTTNTKEECPVDPAVARTSLFIRSSTMHLCQV